MSFRPTVSSDPIVQSGRRIDLMMSDVMLPHIKGSKLLPASRHDLKVLFLTGYPENAAVRGDFTKPFALDALGAKVRAMIER